MFIFIWILVVLCIAAAIGLTVYFSVDYDGTARVVGLLITWLVCIAFCGLMLWALYGTESGKRAQKTLHSETSGGLNRTVKVYDMEGDLIAEYSGKFDVAESATEGITKVKFDCDGKRHIIYGSTGEKTIEFVNGAFVIIKLNTMLDFKEYENFIKRVENAVRDGALIAPPGVDVVVIDKEGKAVKA